jgi:hypothetical protein
MRHRITLHRPEIGREFARAQARLLIALPARQPPVEDVEMLALVIRRPRRCRQLEMGLDDIGDIAQHHRGALLAVFLDDGIDARGTPGRPRPLDHPGRDLRADLVAPYGLEADRVEHNDPVDLPADRRFPVDRFDDSAGR